MVSLRFRLWYFRHAHHLIVVDKRGRFMYCAKCMVVAPIKLED
jgi:hypothetical protein